MDIDGCRITWIAADGTVLYDSQAQQSGMENHADREEVQQALKTGHGESMRYSTTLMERQLYSADLLPDGTVVRISDMQYTPLTLILGMIQPVIIIALLALLLSLLLASRMSKRIVRPLNELSLDNADKIVVLEGGCVVEQGSPAELREKPDGRYRRMLELQRESEAWVL